MVNQQKAAKAIQIAKESNLADCSDSTKLCIEDAELRTLQRIFESIIEVCCL